MIFTGKVRDYLEDTRVTYASDGTLHVIFMHGLNEGRKVYHHFLPAGADPLEAAQWRESGPLCSACIEPDIAADQSGNVYASYESFTANHLGIRGWLSHAGEWGPEHQVTHGNRVRGDIAVTADGKLHVAFFDVAKHVAYYDRYTSYADFVRETREQISTAPAHGTDIEADPNGHVHLSWDQREAAGSDRRVVWYREVIDGRLGEPHQVSGPATGHKGATVAADVSGNVFVAWSVNSASTKESRILEARRIGGQWQGGVFLNGTDTVARLQEYGNSTRGAVYLMLVEAAAGDIASGAAMFWRRAPPMTAAAATPPEPAGSEGGTRPEPSPAQQSQPSTTTSGTPAPWFAFASGTLMAHFFAEALTDGTLSLLLSLGSPALNSVFVAGYIQAIGPAAGVTGVLVKIGSYQQGYQWSWSGQRLT